MKYHKELLAQARYLCRKEPKHPKQASLKRAISTAYYALFHCFIYYTTKKFIPNEHKTLRPLLGRIFEHGKMKNACHELIKKGKNKINIIDDVLPNDLLDVADAFKQLQQARHEADYDMAKQFTKVEASDLVELASVAIDGFEGFYSELHGSLFMIALLNATQHIK